VNPEERAVKLAERLLWVVAVLAAILTLAALSGCATSYAMQSLPQDWWIGLATLAQAVVEDLLSVLRFFV
jgi:hypothetical protein